MTLKPQDVRLHSVETSKGEWGIYVQSAMESESKKTVLMMIILERNIDDERIVSRTLQMSAFASELASASGRDGLLNLIRNWVETTEGDGLIDGIAEFSTRMPEMERGQLVEKLVTSMHLNVPERLALSPRTVGYSEVAAVIRRVLSRCGSFPENARPWHPGDVVDERTMLHKLPDGRIHLTSQCHHPIAPHKLAARSESDFENVASAIAAYIRSEWPHGIDGIAIEPDSPEESLSLD